MSDGLEEVYMIYINKLKEEIEELKQKYNELKNIVIKDNLKRGINIDTINTMYNFK